MQRDLKLDSIAGQIRDAIRGLDNRVIQMRESCGHNVGTELAVRALGEARKHLQIAHDCVHIPEAQS